MARDGLDRLGEIGGFALAPGCDGPVLKAERHIRHHQALVKEQFRPQAVADRAGPERRVEGKQPRLDLGDGEAGNGTGEVFRKGQAFGIALGGCGFEDGDPIGQIQRGTETIGKPRLAARAHHDPVHHNIDIMAEFLVERGRLIELIELPIDLDALKALLAQLHEFLAVFAFAVAHDGGKQIGARPLVQCHDAVDHILHLLRLDGQARGRAEGRAGACEKQAHIVIDLGHGTDGRARVFRCRLLLDGNRRA